MFSSSCLSSFMSNKAKGITFHEGFLQLFYLSTRARVGNTTKVSSIAGLSQLLHFQKTEQGEEKGGRKKKREAGREKRSDLKMTDDREKDEQTSVRVGDKDHQLSHTYTHPSSPLSPRLSITAACQYRCVSAHRFITHQIIYKPPFIHISLSVSAIALPPNLFIYQPAFRRSSICWLHTVCVCVCVY